MGARAGVGVGLEVQQRQDPEGTDWWGENRLSQAPMKGVGGGRLVLCSFFVFFVVFRAY